jgi:hypothetical protein
MILQTKKTIWTIEFRATATSVNVRLFYVDAETSADAIWAFRSQYPFATIDATYKSPW